MLTKHPKYRHISALLLFAIIWISAPVRADVPEVSVLLSSDTSYYKEVYQAFTDHLDKTPARVRVIKQVLAEDDQPLAIDPHSKLVIAVGVNACQKAISHISPSPLLCTFLPRSTFYSLVEKHPQRQKNGTVSAIFLDQPINRYLIMIRQLMPSAKKLGTVAGPVSQELLPEIHTLSQQHNFNITMVYIDEETNPVRILSPLVEYNDVILDIPDHAKLNRVTAKWLLHLSIRHRIPVIAFSKTYANAGAMASIYSTPNDIGTDSGEFVEEWLKNGGAQLSKPRYPKLYSLSINRNVARALRISLGSDAELKAAIDRAEAEAKQ